MARKRKTVENEVLSSLVDKYQLNDLPQFSPERSKIWDNITNEFIELTGTIMSHKQIRERWKNYRASLKRPSKEKDEYLADGGDSGGESPLTFDSDLINEQINQT